MPRYFFDLTDNTVHYSDDVGTELPDVRAAEDEAAVTILQIAKDAMPDGVFRQVSMRVRDETGDEPFEVLVTFELRRKANLDDRR